MDQTNRPFLIPPEFGRYAEKHDLFDLFKKLLQDLIISQPADPLTHLVTVLEKENDSIPKVLVLGPPAAGKETIAKMLAGRLRCPHLTKKTIFMEAKREVKDAIEKLMLHGQPIPDDLWLKALKERLALFDCERKGWVLSGFPQTRSQALALQMKGIFPDHVVLLEAPDAVLIERAQGKRVDPDTDDVYHITFDPPPSDSVAERLVEVEGCSEQEMVHRMADYHHFAGDLIRCYATIFKEINADQPIADVFSNTIDFVSHKARSIAPRNPRIILIGAPGSGKSTQASLLASKYQIIDIDCGQLIRQHIAAETKLGLSMKPFVMQAHKPVPDSLLITMLTERLGQLDCVTRGWVLHGFPRTLSQAETLNQSGFDPSRVFFLDVPVYTVLERLNKRRLDPVTGSRYHEGHNPPTEVHVKDRLLTHSRDSQDDIERRLGRYSGTQEEMLDFYAIHQTVQADQDIHTVFELIESFLVNPLPKKLD